MSEMITVGLVLAKNVFQVHGAVTFYLPPARTSSRMQALK